MITHDMIEMYEDHSWSEIYIKNATDINEQIISIEHMNFWYGDVVYEMNQNGTYVKLFGNHTLFKARMSVLTLPIKMPF